MQQKFKRILIRDNALLKKACNRFRQCKITAVDTETTSLDVRSNRIRLVQIASTDVSGSVVIDLDYITDVQPLKDFLMDTNVKKIMMNGQFDTIQFIHHMNCYPDNIADLMLASQLLAVFKEKTSHSLESICERYLGESLDKSQQASDWSGELSSEQVEYAFKDVEILFPIYDKLIHILREEGLEDTFTVENNCVLAAAMMVYHGMRLDKKYLDVLGKEIEDKLFNIEAEVAKFLPAKQPSLFGPVTIKISSSLELKKELKRVFGVELESVNAGELKKLRKNNPKLIDLLCDHATLRQNHSTYVVGLSKFLNQNTGRLHPELFQLGQPQHRFRATRPNLLNVPRTTTYGPDAPKKSYCYSELSFRRAFIPEEGNKLIVADGDQLQLRIVADISGEPTMISAFNNGDDIHAITASSIYGRTITREDKDARTMGKIANFALIFGAQPQRFKDFLLGDYGIDLSLNECSRIRNKYFAKYKRLAEWHEEQRNLVFDSKKVVVSGGRTVFFSEDSTPFNEAINFPAVLVEQSGMKLAMGNIARRLFKETSTGRIIWSVYDEVVAESSADEAAACGRILEEELVRGLSKYINKVPVIAEAKTGLSWYEAK